MLRSILFLAFALAVSPPLTAFAQEEEEGHNDLLLWPSSSGAATLTGGVVIDGVDSVFDLSARVFEGDLEVVTVPGTFYRAEEPGFFNAGSQSPGVLGATNPLSVSPLPANAQLTISAVGPLQYWDGNGGVAFGSTSAQLAIDTAPLGSADGNGGLDTHPFFDIFLPGSITLPAEGIYLQQLSVQIDSLTPSDPFSVVFVTGEDFEEAAEMAIEALTVPEPASVCLMSLTCLAVVACGRGYRSR